MATVPDSSPLPGPPPVRRHGKGERPPGWLRAYVGPGPGTRTPASETKLPHHCDRCQQPCQTAPAGCAVPRPASGPTHRTPHTRRSPHATHHTHRGWQHTSNTWTAHTTMMWPAAGHAHTTPRRPASPPPHRTHRRKGEDPRHDRGEGPPRACVRAKTGGQGTSNGPRCIRSPTGCVGKGTRTCSRLSDTADSVRFRRGSAPPGGRGSVKREETSGPGLIVLGCSAKPGCREPSKVVHRVHDVSSPQEGARTVTRRRVWVVHWACSSCNKPHSGAASVVRYRHPSPRGKG